jgi:hypothetical protein
MTNSLCLLPDVFDIHSVEPNILKGNVKMLHPSTTFRITNGLEVSVGSSAEWDLVADEVSGLVE